MKPLIHPRLINDPFGDPGVYIEIKWERRALLFDIGNITSLGPARILKVSDIFVSHCHMDHFIGFDHFLRIVLNREKDVRIYGPQGIIECVEGKLRGYIWNLTESYPLSLEVMEVHESQILRKYFQARDGFKPHDLPPLSFTGYLRQEEMFTISTIHLDHKITSMAFAMKERFHINIDRDALYDLGLPVGPWLRTFKQRIWEGARDEEIFQVSYVKEGKEITREFAMGELKNKIATITEGQKISYVTDVIYTPENIEKIINLVRNSDILFCEAFYIDADRDMARERYHLTAKQAGELARMANVKYLQIFHFSPRYRTTPSILYEEALKAFKESKDVRHEI